MTREIWNQLFFFCLLVKWRFLAIISRVFFVKNIVFPVGSHSGNNVWLGHAEASSVYFSAIAIWSTIDQSRCRFFPTNLKRAQPRQRRNLHWAICLSLWFGQASQNYAPQVVCSFLAQNHRPKWKQNTADLCEVNKSLLHFQKSSLDQHWSQTQEEQVGTDDVVITNIFCVNLLKSKMSGTWLSLQLQVHWISKGRVQPPYLTPGISPDHC